MSDDFDLGNVPGLDDGEIGAKLGEGLRSFIDNDWPQVRDFFDDKEGRSEFTKALVKKMWEHAGQEYVAGYVVTDVDYTANGAIWKGDATYIGTFVRFPYTVLAFPNDRDSSFTLRGDGGFLNWCVIGNFTSEDGSPDVYFHETEYSKERKAALEIGGELRY